MLLFPVASKSTSYGDFFHNSAPWVLKQANNCHLCNQPETIDNCFVLSRHAAFFWGVLRILLKKDVDITPLIIRSLPFLNVTRVPYDVLVLLGLYTLWKRHMIDWHAKPPRPAKFIFREQAIMVRRKMVHLSGCI